MAAFRRRGNQRAAGYYCGGAGPERIRPDPDKPNGQQIPHQNRQVYEVVNPDSQDVVGGQMASAAERPVAAPKPDDAANRVAPRPRLRDGAPVQLLPPDPAPVRIDPQGLLTGQALDTTGAPPFSPTLRPPAPIPEPLLSRAPVSAAKPDMQAAAPTPQAQALKPQTPTPSTPTLPAHTPPAPVAVTPLAPTPIVPAKAAPVKAAPAKEAPPQRRKREIAALPLSDSYRVQIGAVRSRETAQREWLRLKRKNRDILGNLQLFIQRVDIVNKGVYYRIQAGPMPDRVLAEFACGQLKARRVGCLIVAQ